VSGIKCSIHTLYRIPRQIVDTELFRTFLEIRTTRHFGRAAENLYITQAAASARIKQLEALLGVTLFIRNRNDIQLSAEGERLVPHAQAMLMTLARARQDLSLDDARSNQLYMGVSNGIWGLVLFEKLLDLQVERPDMALRVESLQTTDIIRMLQNRTVDVAIMYEPLSQAEIHCAPIGELCLKLYSTRKRDTPAAALSDNYIYLDWGGGFSQFHALRFGDQAAPSLRTNMNGMASDYLVHHGGACFMPASFKASLAKIGLTPVRGAPEFKQQLNVAYHSSRGQDEQTERVIRAFARVRV
jgi:LysR family transcriptional regulator, flagellar master operon regulator